MAINGLRSAAGAYATTSDVATAGGMVLVASQTFSAASTVNIDNCFTSNYENYYFELLTTAFSTNILLKMRTSSGDDSSATYVYGSLVTFSDSATQVLASSGSTSMLLTCGWDTTGAKISANVKIYGPNLAARTQLITQFTGGKSSFANFGGGSGGGMVNNTNIHSGFGITGNVGSLTGSIRVYGLRNSI